MIARMLRAALIDVYEERADQIRQRMPLEWQPGFRESQAELQAVLAYIEQLSLDPLPPLRLTHARASARLGWLERPPLRLPQTVLPQFHGARREQIGSAHV